MARGPQAATERGSVQSMKGATVGGGEAAETVVPDEGNHDTLLELLRLKVSRDLPDHRGSGELRSFEALLLPPPPKTTRLFSLRFVCLFVYL